ncbi:ComF family protein [Paenibacillus sp. GXUN7292]|uniref:ComF family protein n=1 Tax=Paenibacillus sp. GXUN7292 TaxID=3422499 RepID=UPI003D7C5E33
MDAIWRKLWKRCSNAFQYSISFLGPQVEACFQCGQAVKHVAGAVSASDVSIGSQHGEQAYYPLDSEWLRSRLCGPCFRTIPWINGIRCPICGRNEQCDDCLRRKSTYFICNRSSVKYDDQMRDWLAVYKYRGNEDKAILLAHMLFPVYEKLTNDIGKALIASQQHFEKNNRHDKQKRKLSLLEQVQKLNFIRHKFTHLSQSIWDAVTYVPISRERELERGFNQAEQLARMLADQYNLPLVNLLGRTRHSDKMSLQSRQARISSAVHLFEARTAELNSFIKYIKHERKHNAAAVIQAKKTSVRLLVIDDIYTTGATANACAKALQTAEIDDPSVFMEIFFLTWARS